MAVSLVLFVLDVEWYLLHESADVEWIGLENADTARTCGISAVFVDSLLTTI